MTKAVVNVVHRHQTGRSDSVFHYLLTHLCPRGGEDCVGELCVARCARRRDHDAPALSRVEASRTAAGGGLEVQLQIPQRFDDALTQFLDRYYKATGDTPSMPVEQLSATLIAMFKGFALSRQNREDMPVTSAKAVRILVGLPL